MELVRIRRALHQIPEIGFQEVKTQAYLMDIISQFPQERIELVKWRTGLAVKVRGDNPTKLIGWRTDMDALAIMEETELEFQSQHPGFMHACGHDIHMTIAIGLLHKLIDEPIQDDVVILFQPAEEGPGGALPFREWLKTDKPDFLPDCIYALHIAPELPVGTVGTRSGLLFANTSELFIDLHGKGGHAAFPHLTEDMAIAAASMLMQLQTVVSRNVNPMDSAVLTIGKLSAGTVQNIIAEHARLEGTIRTLTSESMSQVKQRIEAICRAVEQANNCQVHIDYGSSYLEVKNDETLAENFLRYASQVKGIQAMQSDAAMTGEDFGYFTEQIPGVMFWAGVSSAYGLHHSKLNPDEQVLELMPDFLHGFFLKS
ncbi:N-acetyldiaminopimelate deacetylase [Planococcus sp. ANT_H30]|uniref:N-acetyldiaminopimelate deacetylase n=1 Tax=Planococcus kocurii TaxID=1374 RepID=A0ABN4JXH2_9BACL|nr:MULTISPECIES: N-acetyldiaminopimelate deacetylase [Planococcus]ALS78127.1 N-acetyldiaminopimelate deacetylase [Planococcus kocurii]KAA0958482.1 N-acetyldiaminopimelate deacetylase [Planococcus sp. ANT_H30]